LRFKLYFIYMAVHPAPLQASHESSGFWYIVPIASLHGFGLCWYATAKAQAHACILQDLLVLL